MMIAVSMTAAATVLLAFFFDTIRKNSLIRRRPLSGSSAPKIDMMKSRVQGSAASPRSGWPVTSVKQKLLA